MIVYPVFWVILSLAGVFPPAVDTQPRGKFVAIKLTLARFTLYASLAVLLEACAHQEHIAAPSNLQQYQRAYVRVDSTVTEAVNDLDSLRELIIGELNNRNLYPTTKVNNRKHVPHALLIHVRVIKLHRFSSRRGRPVKQDFDHFNVRQQVDYFSNLRGITIGQSFEKSQVIALVSLVDGDTGKSIAHFHLAGHSARMSYSGIDWRWGDLQDALQDVATQLAIRLAIWKVQPDSEKRKS